MIFLIWSLIIIIMFLLTYIFFMKREIINIAKQLNLYNDFKTEKKINVNLINKQVEVLAESINRHIDVANDLRLNEIKGKDNLKETIANISHDLRTPLTSIIGYIQMLKIKCISDAKNMEYLNRVENKAKDLENMLEDFFTLSVIQSSDYDLRLEYLNINELVCDTLIDFYELLEKKKIVPEINIKQVGRIIGDRKGVIRIIENLISNVLKYSSKELYIELIEYEGKVKLTFMNSLESDKKMDIEKMFNKFYKNSDMSRTSKSTGLGLPIVRTLMEKMNGTVNAEQIKDKLYIICQWDLD